MTHVLVQLRNEFTMSAQTVAGLTCCPTRGAPFYGTHIRESDPVHESKQHQYEMT